LGAIPVADQRFDEHLQALKRSDKEKNRRQEGR
jgi:hypothetical protein